MKFKLYWIDAFAERLGAGNPAGVVPLDAWPADSVMQLIALENGLSETAFFVPVGPARYELRWFAPDAEVDLCGHATLASAFVIFEFLDQAAPEISFQSKGGELGVARRPGGLLELDFPALETLRDQSEALGRQMRAALGVEPKWLGRNSLDILVEVESEEAVRELAPDLARLSALGGRGVIVTAPAASGFDFVSRFFAPAIGIPEDPVTGSAHCALAPFWAMKLGKNRLRAAQLSKRGGTLLCEISGDRVKLAGKAVKYLSADIEI
jgi:PhzF family phenazine biosynthesis protein